MSYLSFATPKPTTGMMEGIGGLGPNIAMTIPAEPKAIAPIFRAMTVDAGHDIGLGLKLVPPFHPAGVSQLMIGGTAMTGGTGGGAGAHPLILNGIEDTARMTGLARFQGGLGQGVIVCKRNSMRGILFMARHATRGLMADHIGLIGWKREGRGMTTGTAVIGKDPMTGEARSQLSP